MRHTRLLLVATVCQALLGLAAVATSPAPRPPGTTWHSSPDPGNGAVLGTDPLGPGALPYPDAAARATTRAAGSSAAVGPTGDNGGGARSTTTTTAAGRPGGTTSTTAHGGGRITATTSTTAAPSGPKCPNPKTCDIYTIIGPQQGGPHGGTKGWRPDADGVVRIRFHVNPEPPAASGLTEDTMEAAFLEGTRIIEAANPRLDYVYVGRTTSRVNNLDGVNVFKFGDGAWHRFDRDGYIVESDIGPRGVPAGSWGYTPCEQRDGGCANTGSDKSEILSTIVHEAMHTTGLADLVEEDTRELTMYSGNSPPGDRHHVTLGLGDVLGLRALYPTSAPMPPIYSP